MFLQLMKRLEGADVLDPAVRAAEPLASRLIADARLRRFFRGDATGIPPHVILTDVPFGAWFMAIFLDLFPDEGSRRAARRLVGLGLLAAAPTGLSGWAEWARADPATRRVGVVHAASNLAATLLFLASWRARRKDRHRLGVRLARVGAVLLVAGGFLGGYMRSVRRP
jgi:hypothetical protein